MKLLLALLAALTLMPACPGCPAPLEPVGDKIVDCSKQTFTRSGFDVMERVNLLLASSGDWGSVRDVAIAQVQDLAVKYGWDVVTCVLGYRRDQAIAGARSNPNDGVSREQARRAQDLMEALKLRVSGALDGGSGSASGG